MAGFDVSRIIAAYQAGTQLKRQREADVQAKEERQLEMQKRKLELDAMKLADKMDARKEALQNAQLMQGQTAPQVSSPLRVQQAAIPDTLPLPGAGARPVSAPTPPAPQQIGTQTVPLPLPKVNIPGVYGPDTQIQPQSLQDLQRMAQEEAQAAAMAKEQEPFTIGKTRVFPRTGASFTEPQAEVTPAPRNIDPLSPEGISARLEFERKRPREAAATTTPKATGEEGLSGLARMVLADPSVARTLTPGDRGKVYEELGKANIRPDTINSQFVTKALDTIDLLATLPGFSGAVGAKGPMSLFGLLSQPLPGTTARNYAEYVETLKGQIALPNLELMRGLGHMSDREFATLASASATLDRDLSESQFKVELGRVRTTLEAIRNRMNRGGAATTSGSERVPEGVDPAIWGVMTPEERALWRK